MSTHVATVEIHSARRRTNGSLKITSDGADFERVLSFADLQNPNALLRALAGNLGGGLADELDLPAVPSSPDALPRKTSLGSAPRPPDHRPRAGDAYRLETRVLDHPIVIYVSSLGEILRVELPGGVTAALDEWNKPS